MTAVILLGHGSRDPRASDAMRSFVVELRDHAMHHTVEIAFLDHNRPTLQEAVDALPVAESDVVVVPMLLSQAFHAKSDVPAAITALRTHKRVRVADPVGSVDALALSAASGLPGPYVLAFSGTSDPLAQRDLASLAERVGAATATPVTVGYVTQAVPDVPTAIAESGAGGVICYTLFPGMFTDRIAQAAAEAGIPCSQPLWRHEALAHAVLEVVGRLGR